MMMPNHRAVNSCRFYLDPAVWVWHKSITDYYTRRVPMQSDSQRLFPVDADERRELAQLFCLALRNVQAYGVDHTVSTTTLGSFYDRIVGLLDRYPELVWSLVEGKVLLNGEPCDLRTADDVLAKSMQKCTLDTFSFLDCISRMEVNRFVVWLATGADTQQAGEAYAGIRISESIYARITRDELEEKDTKVEKGKGGGAGASRGSGAAAGVKKFDLDSMFSEGLDATMEAPDTSASTGGSAQVSQQLRRFVSQQRAADDQREVLLSLIKDAVRDPAVLANIKEQFLSTGGRSDEWDHLCWQAEIGSASATVDLQKRTEQITRLQEDLASLQKRCSMGQYDPETVVQALEKLSGSLSGLMQTIHTQTDSLVDKVHADREQIARLEQAARESGALIQLSREELLESLAEINQELAQPLTVSGALVELLSSGRLGYVDEKQKEVFDMASSSLQRLEVVVKYLQRLSGVPSTMKPDQGLLSEVYQER